jgi:hypothetical protein
MATYAKVVAGAENDKHDEDKIIGIKIHKKTLK